MLLPRDGGNSPGPETEEEDDGVRDAILVTDADTPMGELIVLQLVLSRYAAVTARCLHTNVRLFQFPASASRGDLISVDLFFAALVVLHCWIVMISSSYACNSEHLLPCFDSKNYTCPTAPVILFSKLIS